MSLHTRIQVQPAVLRGKNVKITGRNVSPFPSIAMKSAVVNFITLTVFLPHCVEGQFQGLKCINITLNETQILCLNITTPTVVTMPRHHPKGISFILSPNQITPSKGLCTDSEKSGNCIDFFCTYGYIKNGSSCVKQKVKANKKARTPTFNSCLQVANFSMFLKVNGNELKRPNWKFKSFMGPEYTFEQTLDKNFVRLNSPLTFKLPRIINDVRNQFRYGKFIKKFYYSSTSAHFTKMYGLAFARTFPNGSLCANTLHLPVGKQMQFNTNCTVTIQNQTFDFIALIEQTNNSVIKNEIIVCRQFYHTKRSGCPLRLLSNTSVDENQTLIDHATKKRYKPDEYLPYATGMGTCIQLQRHSAYSWHILLENIERYVTLVGLPVGIFCYVWLLIVFLRNRKLQNISGLTTIGLCISLLLSDIFFLFALFSAKYKKLCTVTAILLHWSLLLGYVWAVIISFEIAISFRSSFTLIRNRRGCKRFWNYASVAILVATATIITSLVLTKTKTLDFKYGGDSGVCWIQNYEAAIFSFVAPVAFLTLTSITLLFYTIFTIDKETKKNKGLIKNSGTDISKVALRLILTLGTIECLGFIRITRSDLSESEEIFNATFQFIFTCMRSFRGCCLWGVLICSRRIKTLHKEWLRKHVFAENKTISFQSGKSVLRIRSTTTESIC
ncbi:uncharacterized protein LOC130649071 [Hydractinia symbiolongicarpus]|uniref:uncharacterized protein LOC130649071 n=1 Tax=Hydractinia symbiolongicarpus TaxID=13093 RepID=UPI0025504402|nr:uncharacterized protein LOC130649071 [Hydractinia symbiolongicarpus]